MKPHRSRLISHALASLVLAASASHALAQVCASYDGGTYTQNFNSLASSGTANNVSTLPLGWAFAELGTGANILYAADTGANANGNTYSYGSSGNSDRALGELTSSTVQSTIGVCFNNNTGPITQFSIGYVGEQWRFGDSGIQDRLNFQFSLDATSLTTGTWTDVNSLDFVSVVTTGSAGARDGNAAANRVTKSPVAIIPASPIPLGTNFFLRWVPVEVAGANDGLAIDDFTLTATVPCSLDFDGDGVVDALTDGLLLMRATLGMTGDAVINGAIGPAARRTTWPLVRQFMNQYCGMNFAL